MIFKMQLKIQIISFSSHVSRMQYSHVASSYHAGQNRHHFHYYGKFYWAALEWTVAIHNGVDKRQGNFCLHKAHDWLGVVAHACNPSTLGG